MINWWIKGVLKGWAICSLIQSGQKNTFVHKNEEIYCRRRKSEKTIVFCDQKSTWQIDLNESLWIFILARLVLRMTPRRKLLSNKTWGCNLDNARLHVYNCINKHFDLDMSICFSWGFICTWSVVDVFSITTLK